MEERWRVLGPDKDYQATRPWPAGIIDPQTIAARLNSSHHGRQQRDISHARAPRPAPWPAVACERHTQGDEAMTHSGPPRTHTGAWVLVTILLLVAVLGRSSSRSTHAAAPSSAASLFYWYQLLWVPVVALLTTICYLITTRVAPRRLTAGAARRQHSPRRPREAS